MNIKHMLCIYKYVNKQAFVSVTNFYRRYKPSTITTTIKQREIIQ